MKPAPFAATRALGPARLTLAELGYARCTDCGNVFPTMHADCPTCARRKQEREDMRLTVPMNAPLPRLAPLAERYDGEWADREAGRRQSREHERAVRDAADERGDGSYDRPARWIG